MTDGKHSLPELLSPAGSQESLRAALAGGADAVYFGGSAFSNRMRAKNFTDDALRDAIKLCHDCGAKAYITVNTRIRGREMDDVMRLCEVILGGEEKCDAVIMADFGLAREVKAKFPHAVLHASTQTSLSSPSDCAELAKIGFTRLVIPREMSYGEIRSLNEKCAPLGFETEMFIHGAHCVSCSGQCLMSFIMGGRSGNRGECAQPCRLPYKISAGGSDPGKSEKNGYPLSLADMCLAGRIPDVISSGVSSLKIEGRLKSAPYVYGVTKIFRTLLDERRCASPDEIRALSELFSRGFTDGYFTNRYAAMKDTSPERSEKSSQNRKSEARLSDTVSKAIGERIASVRGRRLSGEGSVPLTGEFILHAGTAAKFTLSCGGISVSAEGDIPQPAVGRALDKDSASRNLTKLGGTGYSLSPDDIKSDITDGLWLPASSLNELRRRTVDKLTDALSRADAEISPVRSAVSEDKAASSAYKADCGLNKAPEMCAMLCESPAIDSDPAALSALASRFDRIYVPHMRIGKLSGIGVPAEKLCAVLPVLTPDDSEVDRIIADMKKYGISRILCHTIGQVSLVRGAGFTADISYRANITNSSAAEYYRSLGCASVMLSPEMSGGAYRSMGGGAIVYGRLPLMTLARCVICGGKCAKGNIGGRVCSPGAAKPHDCRGYLVDRMGERFPVFGQADCMNVVYNSAVNYVGDCMEQAKGAEQYWFIFTDEDAGTAAAVMDKFGRRAPLGTNVRRI